MAKQTNKEKDIGLMKQFDELKRKHPDALLLFRQGNFYELYKEDAVKATVILAIDITDKLLPGEKEKVPTLRFPQSELDTRLPKLIRAGSRVAICDPLDNPLRKKVGTRNNNPFQTTKIWLRKRKKRSCRKSLSRR